jgi:ABC-2 type transport system permease protein
MWHSLELFEQFVKNDFKLRYKNSYLGLLWVVLKPLSMFAISFVVWSSIFGADPNFKLNLLLGLIIMMFFSELMMMGLSSLMNRAYIILKVNFKREIAVYSATFIAVIDLIVNLFIFFLFSINTHINITIEGVALFFLSMMVLYILSIGITFFISIIFIRLRDTLNLVELAIQLLYWATPIFYPISIIPEKYRVFIEYNPLTAIVITAREGLIEGKFSDSTYFTRLLILGGVSIVILLLGGIYFKSHINKIAEYF